MANETAGLSKTEILLIAVTATSLEGKTLNNARLAHFSNLLTGKSDTANAVELRMREYKKKARELMSCDESGETPAPVTPVPRSKTTKATPNTGDGVKSGRVTKAKKTPKKTAVKVEQKEEEDDLLDENMPDGITGDIVADCGEEV